MELEINSETVNTDEMGDKESDITESINNLYNTCSKYNLTSFTVVLLNDNKFLTANSLRKTDQEGLSQDGEFLFSVINEFISKATGGEAGIAKTKV